MIFFIKFKKQENKTKQ